MDFGARTNSKDLESVRANADAFMQAVAKANASETEREVYVPAGIFYFFPIYMEYLDNMTFTVDGSVFASEDNINWPNKTAKDAQDFWTINDSQNIHITGSGVVDGQGFMWWQREYVQTNHAGRPHLFAMNRVAHCVIENLKWKNSPMFHMNLRDIDDFLIQNFVIDVDIFGQMKIAIMHGLFDYTLNVPTFPLNTDGIDPSGTNIIIRNVSITNFDDAVAVKPAHNTNKIATCASNILVENCHVTFGVGMTIGSVPPATSYACVSNVTFRNITFKDAIKAIYVKTNPGENGYGIIENILYEDIKVVGSIWWTIYIGPQQQKQPGGDGPGCMLYPILKDCQTQPRITVRNITVRNFHSVGEVLTPGIIRCNASNPCTDFTFENVTIKGWFDKYNMGYISENAYGVSINSHPDPHFLSTNATAEEIAEVARQTEEAIETYVDFNTDVIEEFY